MYKIFLKRLGDIILSLIGIIILLPVFLILTIIIYFDDPGPVVFKQKRIGKNKSYFWIHKFRSMKLDAPDVPTHLLENPDKYITHIGRWLRKTSLDELPQLYDILFGRMSLIGPRPALWSQADLITERDKYGANELRPGLTGWAQINGRDVLDIPAKAKLDGEYADALNSGGLRSLAMDVRCFLGTIKAVLKADGVAEGIGGTAPLAEQNPEEKNVKK